MQRFAVPWLCTALAVASCTADDESDSRMLSATSGVGLDRRPDNPRCVAPDSAAGAAQIALQPVFGGATFEMAVLLLPAPDRDDRFYVVEKRGRVRRVEGDRVHGFADLGDRVTSGNGNDERGLLGMAFDPDFARTGRVYLSYTGSDGGQLTSYLSRFVSRDGGLTLDPASEQRLLAVPQPASNHNGGHILFGPDGYLYLGLGDGGGGGDPQGHGQNTDTLLGSMLRLDVATSTPTYRIPADNPFARGGGRPEIYAWGLRNPWRFSFDRATGELWAGDVGQGSYEEIDRIERGRNYGWNVREGFHCYRATTCRSAGLSDPVVEYPRSLGSSVTGGFVYRGSALPALRGQYLFGDFSSGILFAAAAGADGVYQRRELLRADRRISSFGEDRSGELYVVDYGPAGRIYQIVAASTPGGASLPERLSQTGCMDPQAPWRPGPGLVPYGVNAPLWSDGADKERWLAIPDGTRIGVEESGHLDLPPGSVLIKQFRLRGRLVETRLFVRHRDGEWAGHTYLWDADGRDATLQADGSTLAIGDQRWQVPGPVECLRCHTSAAGRTLGLELGQLNGELDYGNGRRANQLATLAHIGMLAAPLPRSLPLIPRPEGDAPLESRARAVLHANCGHCHQPFGAGRGNLDLRFATPLAAANVCDVAPAHGDLGVPGARVLAPGAPQRSTLALRMRALDAHRMPPLASAVIDAAGLGVVESWIRDLRSCQ